MLEKKKQVSISLTAEEKQSLDAIASSMGYTTSALIAAIANKHIALSPPSDLGPIWIEINNIWLAVEDLQRLAAGAPPPSPTDLP